MPSAGSVRRSAPASSPSGTATAAQRRGLPHSPLSRLLRLRTVWGLFLSQGCEVYGGYMLLTWLPTYLQTAKGLNLLDAGMTTAVPFGVAAAMHVVLGRLSDRLLTRDGVHAGRRRWMVAACLAGAAIILLVPFLDNLWAIVAVLSIARSMGGAAAACNFALVTDLVRNPADVGKVTSITVLGGNSFGMMGPIVTGYVVALTGGFNATFAVAGILALTGALISLTMTRQPIEAQRLSPAPRRNSHDDGSSTLKLTVTLRRVNLAGECECSGSWASSRW
jgi:MFS family permease